jgi:hypothetical protein
MSKRVTFLSILVLVADFVSVSAQKLKGHPRIFHSYDKLCNRKPMARGLNVNLYSKAYWSNYEGVRHSIKYYQASLFSNGISVSGLKNNVSVAVISIQAVSIISNVSIQ